MRDPKTLREGLELYREGKMQRRDFVGRLVDEIEALQARIGSVDEAAIAALDKRVSGMETTIGNALARVPASIPFAEWKPDNLTLAGGNGVVDARTETAPKRKGWPKGKKRKPAAPIEATAPAVAGD